MLDWMNWIIGYWSVLVWAIPLIISFVFTRHLFGRRFTLPIGFLASTIIVFLLGRKIERDNYEKLAQDIKDKRKKAYEKIDQRNTDRADAVDRLRHGDF